MIPWQPYGQIFCLLIVFGPFFYFLMRVWNPTSPRVNRLEREDRFNVGKLIRLFLLVLLLPMFYAFVREGVLSLMSDVQTPRLIWFFAGFLFYVLLYGFFLVGHVDFAEHFEHELGHTVLATVFLIPLRRFIVNPEEGSLVEYTRPSNFLVTLAPYYFPVFTLPFLIIRPWMASSLHWIFDILIGLTLAFHYTSLFREFRLYQTDLKSVGFLFAIGMTVVLNLVILVAVVHIISGDYVSLLDYIRASFKRGLEYYNRLITGPA